MSAPRTITLDITILGREFKVACKERERDELLEAVALLDKRMREIRDAGKVTGTDRIAVMTALTFYMPLLIYVTGKVSVGHILVGYVGLLFLGAAATAIALFASSLARSTVVAVIVGAALLAVIILQWAVARAVDPPLNKFLSAIALHHENFRPFMQGILQLSGIAYYLAITYFFLLCATKVLEARRWR